MKAQELREKSFEELLGQQALLQKELFDLRLKKARGETPKPGQQKMTRRDLARVMTVLTEYRRTMKVVGNNEEVAVRALRQNKWNANATVVVLERQELEKQSGHAEQVVDLATTLTRGQEGKTDLPRALNLIRGAELIVGGKDEKKVLTALAQLNRDGLETALSFRKALEGAVKQANAGTPEVVIRMALADTRYNLERTNARVAETLKLAQETGVEPHAALTALQAAEGDAVLAAKRIKKKAKAAAKAKA